MSEEGRRGAIKTCSCASDPVPFRRDNPTESDTLMLMLCARRCVRAPARVLRGWPLSLSPNVIVELDAIGAGAGSGGLRPATASANVLLGRVAEGETAGLQVGKASASNWVGVLSDIALIVGTWISILVHPSSSSCSSMIVVRVFKEIGGGWSLNDGWSAYRRGRTTGGGRARKGIEDEEICIGVIVASNGTGDGSEKGVVGVVGMDDAVVDGDDMTRLVFAIFKFSVRERLLR